MITGLDIDPGPECQEGFAGSGRLPFTEDLKGCDMPQIHPSSIVDPQARLADDVVVGPQCVIEGEVEIAAGTRIVGQSFLRGPLRIGQNNTIYPSCHIGFEPQHRGFAGKTTGVSIGDNNILREGVTVHAALNDQVKPTSIGNGNLLMTNTHVAHDVIIHNDCTLTSGALIGGHSTIFNNVILGGNAAVHQFCRVGRLCMIGGLSGISKDQPPFTTVSGLNNVISLNFVGLRRSGLERDGINELKKAYDLFYHSNHTVPVAIAKMQELADKGGPGQSHINEVLDFMRQSERGLSAHAMQSSKHKMQR